MSYSSRSLMVSLRRFLSISSVEEDEEEVAEGGGCCCCLC